MFNKYIIIISLCLIYYHISGLSTTNILRLTAGNTLPVYSKSCICDSCGKKIPFFLQLPIISYIICKGKCKYCGTRIPVFPLLLEIFVFIGMSLLSFCLCFSFTGVLFSYIFYEIIRICVVFLKGRRKEDFVKQYVIAVLLMFPFVGCSLFVALLYKIV